MVFEWLNVKVPCLLGFGRHMLKFADKQFDALENKIGLENVKYVESLKRL